MSRKEDSNGAGGALGMDEASIRSLLRHGAVDVVAVLDADGTVRYVSPAVETMLGYAPEEVVGNPVFDYVHSEDLERAVGALAETLVTPGALPPMGVVPTTRGGTWRWCATTGWGIRTWRGS